MHSSCNNGLYQGQAFKDAPWYNEGGKAFLYSGKEARAKAYKEAFNLIEKLFPEMKMTKSPFGSVNYVPEEDLKKALGKGER